MGDEKVEKIEVGGETLSYCGKCKKSSTHVIASMKDSKNIGKCQCLTCKARHNYRDPDATSKPRKKRGTTAEVPAEEMWKQAMADVKGDPKAYAMNQKFSEGDLINHPSFGRGVVEKLVDNNKIAIIFEHDHKLLIHAQ